MPLIWASIPMGYRVVGGDCDRVNTADQRHARAARLVQADQDFPDATPGPGASLAAPATVAPQEEAPQEIKPDWYRLAYAAAPPIATRRRLPEIQADAGAGTLSRSRTPTSRRPCTTSSLIAEPLIAAYASARRSGRDSGPPSAAGRALDPCLSPRVDQL